MIRRVGRIGIISLIFIELMVSVMKMNRSVVWWFFEMGFFEVVK